MAHTAIQARPTEFHKVLQMLDDSGMLKRLYSQNIDGLEAKVGFDTFATTKTRKCVLLHGNIATLRCGKCAAMYLLENYLASLGNGEPIACPGCTQKQDSDLALAKRVKTPGHLRPNILLYNEPCTAAEDIADITDCDTASIKPAHVLLICGTSLHIPGVQNIIKSFKTAMFSGKLHGCAVIYVDITSSPPPILSEGTRHVQMDCQQFATNVMSKFQESMVKEGNRVRKDFRPFWDWN